MSLIDKCKEYINDPNRSCFGLELHEFHIEEIVKAFEKLEEFKVKSYKELLLLQYPNGYMDVNQPKTIDDLIDSMEKCRSRRDMTEESQGGYSSDAQIGEFQYGVSSVPVRWVLQIIKEYKNILDSQ